MNHTINRTSRGDRSDKREAFYIFIYIEDKRRAIAPHSPQCIHRANKIKLKNTVKVSMK